MRADTFGRLWLVGKHEGALRVRERDHYPRKAP